jgi:hypothetical protein
MATFQSSPSNVGLAFLDECITDIEKEKVFQNLEKPERKKGLKRLDGKNLVFERKVVSDFVTSGTKTFFAIFGVNDVSEYCNDALRSSINSLKLVLKW